MDKNWKDKDTIRFLKLYEKEKCLWNYKHENYRNQSTRKASVLKILKGMNKPGLTDSEVRNKIRNIRSTYAQELTKFIRALKENRKGYMSSLVWFPIAHNFLRKVVASKSLEKNTDNNSIGASETDVVESDTKKVKKPPMVGDSPNSDENSDDSREVDSPFDSPGSPVDTNTETTETSHIEGSQVEVASASFNSQNFHNAADTKIETLNSDNSQAETTQNLYYLQDILNAANSKVEIPNNVNYQIVDAQNIFYLQDSLDSTSQLIDIAKCSNVQVLQVQNPNLQNSPNPAKNIEITKSSNVQVLQVQHPVNLQNSPNLIRNIETPKSHNMQVLQVQSPVSLQNSPNPTRNTEIPKSSNVQVFQLQNSPNPTRNTEIPKSSNVQVFQLQNPVNLQNSLGKNIEVSKSNNIKILQVQRPVPLQNSLSPVTRKIVERPNSNMSLIEAQSPDYLQNSTSVEKRKEVDMPNSDSNVQAVEVQNPVPLQNSIKPKRKRKAKELNTVQVQESTKPENLVQDEFFHFSQNVASQLRKLPLKSALLCQAKILETIAKERIAASEKISTAPTVQPLVVQRPERSKKISNINYDQWESDNSDE